MAKAPNKDFENTKWSGHTLINRGGTEANPNPNQPKPG